MFLQPLLFLFFNFIDLPQTETESAFITIDGRLKKNALGQRGSVHSEKGFLYKIATCSAYRGSNVRCIFGRGLVRNLQFDSFNSRRQIRNCRLHPDHQQNQKHNQQKLKKHQPEKNCKKRKQVSLREINDNQNKRW